MRIDDNIGLPAAAEPAPAPDVVVGTAVPRESKPGLRFTSNVVGFLFLVADIGCFAVSAPITLLAYSLLRESRLVVPVHITAFVLMLGSFLLIRTSYGRR